MTVPGVWPRVTRALVPPSELLVLTMLDRVALPAVTFQVMGAFTIGLPQLSVSVAERAFRTVPGRPVCASPESWINLVALPWVTLIRKLA